LTSFLRGRVAVVTGGAQNIGRVLVEALAKAGASVLFCDILDGEAPAAALRAKGYDVRYQFADIRQAAQIQQLAQTAVGMGRLDIWVHNAAVDIRRPIVELEADEWDAVHDVCLRAAYLGAKFAIPHMRPGSSIINIASVHALVMYAQAAAYDSAKAGLIALTRQIAAEYGGHGIRANVIVPGLIIQPDSPDDYYTASVRHYPVGRVGKADDVANALLFLVSEQASFMNGASLLMDGGMTARSPEWTTHEVLDEAYSAAQDANDTTNAEQ